jgi:hypothetical protein
MPTVHSPRLIRSAGTVRAEICIDDQVLWFEGPEHALVGNIADAALCACLVPAMHSGEDIHLAEDLRVSSCLLERTTELQSFIQHWFPRRFRRVGIHTRPAPSAPKSASTGSFFSGGVDSLYSLMTQPNIDSLIFVHGIDMQLDNHAQFALALRANQELATHFGKRLISVVSNVRQFITGHGFSWTLGQGGGLSSVAHLLDCATVIIPASDSYVALRPYGSHPVTDPMWSSEATHFIHHGLIRRIDKTRVIAADQYAIDRLRVCWMDDGYNCGKCFKCLRTMTALRVLGARSSAFPVLDPAQMQSIPIYDEGEMDFLEENLEQAVAHEDRLMAGILKRRLRELKSRQVLRRIKRFANTFSV